MDPEERQWRSRKDRYLLYVNGIDLCVAMIGQPLHWGEEPELDQWDHSERNIRLVGRQVDAVRQEIAALLGATQADRIAFGTQSTGVFEEALRTLPLRKGEEILTTTSEYGSMPIAMKCRASHSDATVRQIPGGQDLAARLEQEIRPTTRIVVTSHITHYGELLPAKEIGEVVHRKGATYILDAAQSIGHIQVDVKDLGADIVVGSGHKWLRGKTVCGFAYFAPHMQPTKYSTSGPFAVPAWTLQHAKSYIDVDVFGNSEAILHLGRNLQLYQQIGWQDIYDRIKSLGDYAQHLLQQNDRVEHVYRTPGIVTFRLRDEDQAAAQQRLQAAGVYIVHKKDADVLRASFSPFNTKDDVEQFSYALQGKTTRHAWSDRIWKAFCLRPVP